LEEGIFHVSCSETLRRFTAETSRTMPGCKSRVYDILPESSRPPHCNTRLIRTASVSVSTAAAGPAGRPAGRTSSSRRRREKYSLSAETTVVAASAAAVPSLVRTGRTGWMPDGGSIYIRNQPGDRHRSPLVASEQLVAVAAAKAVAAAR